MNYTREMFQKIPVGIMKARVSDCIEIVEANDFYFQMFGTDPSDYGQGAFSRFGESDRRVFVSYILQCSANKEDIHLEYKTTHKQTDEVIYVKLDARYIGTEEHDSKECAMYLCSLFDITEQKKKDAKMEEISDLYMKAISSSDEVIFDYVIDEDIFTYYQLIEEHGVIVNQPNVKEHFLEEVGRTRYVYPDDLVYFYDLCRDNIKHPFDIRVKRDRNKNGEYTRMRVHATVQKDSNGRPMRVIGTVRPISQVEASKLDEVTEKVDELTGLNSRMMAKKLIEEFKSNSSVSIPYALMILDVKDFKKVNDTYGHIFGDNVLVQVADIIIENINNNDIVGRLGGDEFLIFLKNVGERAVVSMCDKLCRAIRDIYVGDELKIDACIGAVVSQDPAVGYEDLLQSADDALFELITNDRVGVQIAKEISSHSRQLRLSYVADRNLRRNMSAKEKRLSELISELLEKSKDVDKALNTVLALIGEKKNLSRITVMQKLGNELEVTYQWTGRGIESNPKVDGEKILNYKQSMAEYFTEEGMGIIDERTVANYNSELKDVLLPQGAKSLLYCDMIEFGEVAGMIAYVDCSGQREWRDKDYKSFRTLTRLICAYTLKAKAMKRDSEV